VRFEERPEPAIVEPTDAIVRLSATCICGSDLWPYRGANPINGPAPMGHEYCGIVEDVGHAVTSVRRGQFVIGSFFASDNTCPHCRAGYHTSCAHRQPVLGAQAPLLRVPLADGTLVSTWDVPSKEFVSSFLALSDVMGTGWFAAVAADVRPGGTVIVVGDGAVGLLGVLSARHMGAERIIAMSRHVGVPHGVELDGRQLFFTHVRLHGGPAPVRRFLPELIDLVLDGRMNPGKVFDLTLPLDEVAEGYRAMDERRAIKALLTVA
jgi:threonine dehydrogenase-like Zn-dependent dehydrogenase